MDWDLDVSRDFVGAVLLGLTAAFGLAAFVLAWRGLGKAAAVAKTGGDDVQRDQERRGEVAVCSR